MLTCVLTARVMHECGGQVSLVRELLERVGFEATLVQREPCHALACPVPPALPILSCPLPIPLPTPRFPTHQTPVISQVQDSLPLEEQHRRPGDPLESVLTRGTALVTWQLKEQ